MKPWQECLTGGTAACCACVFSNPLEVVKTRMQLQGELQAFGTYKVHYRHVFHAFFTIARVDGLVALQKGLGPGLAYQFVMNGLRLGTYQQFQNRGLTVDQNGNLSYWRCVIAGATSGCIGSLAASPAYMIKTQLQAKTNTEIAVGTQHNINSTLGAWRAIYQQYGILGLWRGASGAVLRVSVGSAVQLSVFSKTKDVIVQSGFFEKGSVAIPISSSMLASIFVVVAMTPFDVVSTRLYNQGVSSTGKGVIYANIGDVFRKIFQTEGLMGFYKGIGAHYFRLGPHTVLSLVFWDMLRQVVNS